jgi:DNA repair protein RadD
MMSLLISPLEVELGRYMSTPFPTGASTETSEEHLWQPQLRTILKKISQDKLIRLLDPNKDTAKRLAGSIRKSKAKRLGKSADQVSLVNDDLVMALFIKYQKDILAQPEIRKAITALPDYKHIENPGKWFSGKAGALKFVEALQLPKELAGEAYNDDRPPQYLISAGVTLKPLDDFQKECANEILDFLSNSNQNRALLSLPTGAGKTRTCIESVYDWCLAADLSGKRKKYVVWIAHTEELCEQAVQCFDEVFRAKTGCSLFIARMWGNFTTGNTSLASEHHAVLITTPQTFINHQLVSNCPDLIVIDEAHRSAAKTYRQIIHSAEVTVPHVKILGMTATPFCKEYNANSQGTKELQDIFNRKLILPVRTFGEKNTRTALVDRGVLAKPEFNYHRIDAFKDIPGFTPLDPDNVESKDRELCDKLAGTRNPHEMRHDILELIHGIASNPSHLILYFSFRIEDAIIMTYLLKDSGIRAAFVSGETKDHARRQTIQAFKDQSIQVLSSCDVLTTGFDEPKVTHIVIARPTVSRVLVQQMVGRGLRGPKFGGTSHCQVLHFQANLEEMFLYNEPWLDQ